MEKRTVPHLHEDKFRFHREWYLRSAIGDLLGEDYSLAQKDKPYRCLDLLLKHRDELFGFLKGQWGNLFGAKYDVLLPIFMRTSL